MGKSPVKVESLPLPLPSPPFTTPTLVPTPPSNGLPPSQPTPTSPKKRGRPPKDRSLTSRFSPPPPLSIPLDNNFSYDNNNPHKKPRRFMLHRSLPTMDLFTSAESLSNDDLSSMVNVTDTDVVAVLPSEVKSEDRDESSSLSLPVAPVPTLADVNPNPIASVSSIKAGVAGSSRVPPVPSPVTLLYYDPFSSFAPSYDSTHSTVSYTQTTSHKLDRARVKKWESDHLSLAPSTSTTTARLTPSSSSLVEQELLSLGLDEEVLNVARKVLREGDVWDRLEENGVRLGVLQKAQWDRLKRGSAETGQVEATAAKELLDSLTALLPSLPPVTFLPPPLVLSRAVPLILGAEARDPSYIGTFDNLNNAKAVRDSAMKKGAGKR